MDNHTQQPALLILSPQRTMRQQIVEMFPPGSYQLFTSQNLSEALIVCHDHPVKLVVLDTFDEGLEYQLCQEILSAKLSSTPRIMMLMESMAEEAVKLALRAGAVDVMLKPIFPDLMRQRVHWLIQSMRAAELQSAYQQSEERLRTIVTNAPLILFAYDANGELTFVAGRALESIGRTSEQLLGQSVFDVQMIPQVAEDTRYVIETGQPINTTLTFNDLSFEVWYNPLLDDEGRVSKVIGVATNVTTRENAEKNLERSLNFYLTFFEDFPVPIWRSGRDAKLNYLNQSWLEFTGKSLDEALRDGWLEDIHPDDRRVWQESFINHFRRHEAFEMEYRMRRQDGSYRIVASVGQPFYELDGKFGGFIGLLYDLTDRKQVEEHQIQLNLERERVKMLQEFISTVSHDLKTPLSSIILYTDLLRRTDGAEQRATYGKVVDEQAQSLRQMLENMLAMSRLEEEITTLTFQLTDISDILRDVAQFHRLAIEQQGLEIEINIDAKMPRMLANAAELRRCLNNLLDNAIKYTDTGKITVRGSYQNQQIVVEIEDTGIGVAPDDIPHIFDRFFRADRSRGKVGTGLGLSIVKKIVEVHGGFIQVESEPNKGTLMRLILPTLSAMLGQPRH